MPPSDVMTSRRKLLLALRRRVHAHSRFDVDALGNGRERLTCRTCGHVTEEPVGGHARATGGPAVGSKLLADRLAAYHANNGGVSGECRNCTKIERDRRYPLPKGE